MAVKTVLNITPKVFTAVATGAAASVAAFGAAHFDPAWLSFLPTPEQAPAVSGAVVLLSGIAAWLKSETGTETAGEAQASADVAETAEKIIPITYATTAPVPPAVTPPPPTPTSTSATATAPSPVAAPTGASTAS